MLRLQSRLAWVLFASFLAAACSSGPKPVTAPDRPVSVEAPGAPAEPELNKADVPGEEGQLDGPAAPSAVDPNPAEPQSAGPADSTAQPPAAVPSVGAPEAEDQGGADRLPGGAEDPKGTERSVYERCGDGPDGPEWLDKFGYGVYRTVCASATWLDNFFGGDRGLRERDTSYGRVGLGASWDEFNGTSVKARFKAKVQLPRAKNRFNAFVGRYEQDEFVSGVVDDIGAVPSVFRATEEKDWLLGFGYNPVRSSRARLDFDAGVRVDFPVDPFFKGTWRYYAFMNKKSLLRVAQTVFWTNQLEFGTTTRIDAERVLGENFHLRWQGLGTAAQETSGVDWRTSLILYQNFGNLRAIAWEAEAEGETDAPVHLDHYGVRATYRQRVFRDDLFLELQARVFWPKSVEEPEREATPGIGFGFEMLWGDQPKLFRPWTGKNKNTAKAPPRTPTRN